MGLLFGAVLLASYSPVARAEDVLLWADEFDGTAVDTNNWEFMIGDGSAYGNPGWGNNEWQYYTSRPENVFVAGGALHIVARHESYGGKQYTSARLRSQGKQEFLYGRFEARMKIPSGTGVWPALWMMPTNSPYGGWAACGEIDLMESVNTATSVFGTIHYGGSWPNNVHTGGEYSKNGVNFGDDFHVYTFEWRPDTMRWYVDGVYYHLESSNTWYTNAAPNNPRAPFDTPFHLLVNVAVGGNWPGSPNPAAYPQELIVDYIRVYDVNTQTPYLGVATTLPGRIEAENFDAGGEGISFHDCDAANRGGAYRANVGVDLEACAEGGFNVGWMCDGEWIEYSVWAPVGGTYVAAARVSSQSTGGTLHLEMGGVDVTGPMTVPVTGGWQTWKTVEARAELTAGAQVLRFVNDGLGKSYNVNWFAFYAVADVDRDFDVDAADAGVVLRALAGPGIALAPGGVTVQEFGRSDLDGDGDVDLADAARLQRGVGG